MTWPDVEPPAEVEGDAPHLGRLGPAVRWLAAAQARWPPRPPRTRRVVLPSTGGSLESGRATADDAADRGDDLLVLVSTGLPEPGLVVAAALLGLEPVRAVGTGGAPGWADLVVGVRDGVRAVRPHLGDPPALLATAGDGAAELAGLLAQAAVRRTPVLLDGSPLAAGAALAASRLAPGAERWWLAGQAPAFPGAAAALSALGLAPMLDLGLAGPHAADLAEVVLAFAVDLVRPTGDA